jgi:hypothetical protein
MAISVAPLTTVVMSSAGQNRAGTLWHQQRSRPRGSVLAIAILGIVMVKMFGSYLERKPAQINISIRNPKTNAWEIAARIVRGKWRSRMAEVPARVE